MDALKDLHEFMRSLEAIETSDDLHSAIISRLFRLVLDIDADTEDFSKFLKVAGKVLSGLNGDDQLDLVRGFAAVSGFLSSIKS